MKKIVIKILNWLSRRRWSRYVTLSSEPAFFYRTTHIHLLEGATNNNILIGAGSQIYGTLAACAKGRIIIGDHAKIGANSSIKAVDSIVIGDLTAIASNVVICDNNNHPVNPKDREIMRLTPSGSFERSWQNSDHSPISIGKNVWIGENVRICKGVAIGDGAVIAASSVVTKDVPANSVAAGNPAKIVKTDIDINTKRYFV